MNTDIRLSVGFWSHPKTKRLIKELGLEGVRSLQVLWSWVAQERPDGSLSGMDATDIELAADWEGEDGLFANAVIGRWIDEIDGQYVLHDWSDHNPWAAGASERSEKAKRAAEKRWERASSCSNDATSNANACYEHSQAMLNPCPSAPLPSPFPSPEENTREEPPIAPLEGGDVCGEPKAFSAFWAAYPKKTGKKAALTAWKKAKGKPPVEDVLAAITRQQEWPQWQRDGGQYIPNPATWLNQGRWSDEPPPIASRASPQFAPMTRDEQVRAHNDAVFQQLMEESRGLQS